MYCKTVRQFSSLANSIKANISSATLATQTTLPNTPQPLKDADIAFIREMVSDEMHELAQATTLSQQADALVDAIYYIQDAAAKKGINLDPIFEIVHQANLAKVKNKAKAKRHSNGKVMKPEGWVDPEKLIQKELSRQTSQGAF